MESSKFKLNKTKFIQISLLLLAFFLIFFTYFFNLKKKQPFTNLDQIKTVKPDKQKEKVAVNTFFDVQYSGFDKNGNRFVTGSKYANFEIDRPNVIRMEQVLCVFYFKDDTKLTIVSDYGIYNNVTNDMEFTGNIKMNYLENVLFSEKANFFNVKNELLIEGNVKTTSPEGKLQADKLDFDLDSKRLKISMYNDEKVNIKVNF
jgi:LPS export ABC transporter protein LptC